MEAAAHHTEFRTNSTCLQHPHWISQHPWLWHGFSTRLGGVTSAYSTDRSASELNLGFTPDDPPENILENRLRLAHAVSDSRNTPLVSIRQVHSAHSVVLRPGDFPWTELPQADGILTDATGLLLAVQTADCVPVLVADPVNRFVAAFHAGWRGTVQRVVQLGVARMAAQFGCVPDTLIAAIGPAIGPCCYTVGLELRSQFEHNFSYAADLFCPAATQNSDQSPALQLDLIEANRRQLLDSGLNPANIAALGGCTACQPHRFFSHRAQKGHTGRMVSVIGIRPNPSS